MGECPNSHELVDSEVNKLLNDSYSRACYVLKKHRKELDLIADKIAMKEGGSSPPWLVTP